MSMKKVIFPYLLVLPLIVIMFGLVFYPAVLTLVDSFKQLSLMEPDNIKFAGFSNYINLLTDSTVLRTLKNTSAYYFLAIAGEVVGGMYIAMVLKKKFRGRGLLLAAVVIPWALPPVVNAVIWKWIYDPNTGVLNDLLLKLHIIHESQVWLGNPHFALFCVTLVHVWKMIPLTAVILLASLQTIPGELYEAAKIDGASPVRSFWHITLPLLKPALAIALTQATFAAINIFDEIFVLTGSALDTRSVLIQNYLIAFRQLNLGMGMALSLIITLITLGISLIYIIWLNERKEK